MTTWTGTDKQPRGRVSRVERALVLCCAVRELVRKQRCAQRPQACSNDVIDRLVPALQHASSACPASFNRGSCTAVQRVPANIEAYMLVQGTGCADCPPHLWPIWRHQVTLQGLHSATWQHVQVMSHLVPLDVFQITHLAPSLGTYTCSFEFCRDSLQIAFSCVRHFMHDQAIREISHAIPTTASPVRENNKKFKSAHLSSQGAKRWE